MSLRSDYAVRAMVALARHDLDVSAGAVARPSFLSARTIAARMDIPTRYVAHVVADLARADLVVARTGRTGGYLLARPADRINLLEVVDAVERGTDRGADARRCVLRGNPCGQDGRCAVHESVTKATAALSAELARTSLAQLARQAA